MSQQRSINNVSLPQLISGCCREQTQILANRGCCFELFRRAIELRDDRAWLAIQRQFQPLFMRWVLESIPGKVDHFMVDDLLQIALERFWCCLSASERPLAERFSYAGELLKYMKCCIRSACLEWRRGQQRHSRLQDRLTMLVDTPARRPLERLLSQKVHDSRCVDVRQWLEHHCRNEAEALVYQLSYEEDLKPRQIVAQHPEHFPDVQDVYRIKQRLCRRVQRAFDWEE